MELTPKEIVKYLDDFIIGQKEAKKAIAIALRNRYRRLRLDDDMRDEVLPKNILMIGPTGVGKTEIARRMAKMFGLPFVKVEATKYTEVGFVGRDVESMVRDLVHDSIKIVRAEHEEENKSKIEDYVLDEITKKLLPNLPKGATEEKQADHAKTFAKLREIVKSGEKDDSTIEIDYEPRTSIEIVADNDSMPPEFGKLQDTFSKILGSNKKIKKEVTIKEAKKYFEGEATEKLLDMEAVKEEALKRAESGGIIFIDEMDKVAISEKSSGRNDPSKEGVQRDLLPIVEGSSINTKYGIISTDHILFIAAGAFHMTKPSDLIAELQGRFPLRVELDSLTEEDLFKILTTTKNSLIKQYIALLKVEEVELEFPENSIRLMSKYASMANEKTENIGARRLHTVIEKVIEDISFEAEEHKGQKVVVEEKLINEKLEDVVDSEDVTRYIL
ncbi:MAG: ATP-dependent protease ATPase subunit HslU [Campylobacterales bacterium]|nr:ATP-dependent protease ATPase subunit HslU [Campylobacterales bacterium]